MFWKKTWRDIAWQKIKRIAEKTWASAKKNPRLAVGLLGLAVIIVAGALLSLKNGFRGEKSQPKEYEIAVQVRDQTNPDPEEDMRTSMKAGDVVVIQPVGHSWSMTERVSYLILKIKLDDEQKGRLTRPQERKLSRKEIKEKRPKNWDDLPKEERDRFEDEEKNRPQTQTVRTREYRIDLEKIGFSDPNVLLSGQPLLDKTFDWGIVDKK